MSEPTLDTVAVGDPVVVNPRRGLLRLVPVTATTKTTVTADGIRFLKRGGREIGAGAWSFALARPYVPERDDPALAAARVQRAQRALASSIEQLAVKVRTHAPGRLDAEQTLALARAVAAIENALDQPARIPLLAAAIDSIPTTIPDAD